MNRPKEPGASAPARKPRLLFLFPHPIAEELGNVRSGVSPTERLYGAYELIDRGWQVQFSDSRFRGLTGRFLKFLRQFSVMGISIGTVRDIASCDIVVVKDDFSAPTAIAARLLGKKLVFLDSMFAPPRRWWKVLGTRISLRLAHETICYSEHQKRVWVDDMGPIAESIRVLPYTIDVKFYRRFVSGGRPRGRRVLAVGRDVGRDYATLVKAVSGTDISLDLITLPYLLRGLDTASNPNITVHQRLSYEDLFRLYAECSLVVIPLKPGISYPSGIRALLEAMVIERPFVATRNEVLQEYMTENVHGRMVEAQDPEALRESIETALASSDEGWRQVDAATDWVKARYDASVFADRFEELLLELGRR